MQNQPSPPHIGRKANSPPGPRPHRSSSNTTRRSPGEPEWPLRLIIIGHNPSDTAWQQGHYYANPSNRMYKLLATAKIIPVGFSATDDDKCPIMCGVGFTDVVSTVRIRDREACTKRWVVNSWRASANDSENAQLTVPGLRRWRGGSLTR